MLNTIEYLHIYIYLLTVFLLWHTFLNYCTALLFCFVFFYLLICIFLYLTSAIKELLMLIWAAPVKLLDGLIAQVRPSCTFNREVLVHINSVHRDVVGESMRSRHERWRADRNICPRFKWCDTNTTAQIICHRLRGKFWFSDIYPKVREILQLANLIDECLRSNNGDDRFSLLSFPF